MRAKDKLIAGRIQLMKENPFFAYILLNLNLIETKSIPSCAVDYKGNLYYNPEFIKSLTLKEVKGVLCHECLHLVFEHLMRGKGKVQTLWNLACDSVINAIILKNGLDLPKESIVPYRLSLIHI